MGNIAKIRLAIDNVEVHDGGVGVRCVSSYFCVSFKFLTKHF